VVALENIAVLVLIDLAFGSFVLWAVDLVVAGQISSRPQLVGQGDKTRPLGPQTGSFAINSGWRERRNVSG
jgi:hypothetical protein